MRLLLAAGAALSFAALPALAESTTVEFVGADGVTSVIVFNADGTALMEDGTSVPYTMDKETKTLCGTTDEGEICATFDELGEEVGFSTGFTNTAGQSGTATITAKD